MRSFNRKLPQSLMILRPSRWLIPMPYEPHLALRTWVKYHDLGHVFMMTLTRVLAKPASRGRPRTIEPHILFVKSSVGDLGQALFLELIHEEFRLRLNELLLGHGLILFEEVFLGVTEGVMLWTVFEEFISVLFLRFFDSFAQLFVSDLREQLWLFYFRGSSLLNILNLIKLWIRHQKLRRMLDRRSLSLRHNFNFLFLLLRLLSYHLNLLQSKLQRFALLSRLLSSCDFGLLNYLLMNCLDWKQQILIARPFQCVFLPFVKFSHFEDLSAPVCRYGTCYFMVLQLLIRYSMECFRRYLSSINSSYWRHRIDLLFALRS